MNTQYRKNLKAVLEASKSYTDKVAKDLQWQLGTYDLGVDTVNSTTSLLPTPANTIQATMVRVDGVSEVSENLLNIPNGTITSASVSFVFANGVCNSSGTPSMTGWIRIKAITLPAGTYYFKDFTIATNPMRIIDSNYNAKTTQPFTLTNQETMWLAVTGNSINDYGQLINSKPMLVSGSSEPTTWKQGFSGIHNLELSGLKVEGANLCSGYTTPNWRIYINANLKPNTTYYFSCDSTTTVPHAYINNTSNQHLQTLWVSDYSKKITDFSFTTSNDVNGDVILEFAMNAEQNTITWAMLNYGNTAKTFVPYIAPTTKTIDLSTILYNGSPLFEGNSLKGVGSVADEITPSNATKRMLKITLNGSEAWETEGQGATSGYKYKVPISITPLVYNDNILCDKLDIDTTNIKLEQIGYCRFNTAKTYFIVNYDISSLSNFKTNLASNPITLIYAIATPIEVSIDFSQLVKFEAHSNGSITLVNTNNQDTTSTFKYLKEVAK